MAKYRQPPMSQCAQSKRLYTRAAKRRRKVEFHPGIWVISVLSEARFCREDPTPSR